MRFCIPVSGGPGGGASAGTNDVGGKARSLARLAMAGWPVPTAFAVGTGLYRQLRRGGPALPLQLRDAADLAVLERAREALLAAPYPPGFEDELRDNIARLAGARSRRLGARFSVRSSFASEDRPGALAAGLFHSATDVPLTAMSRAVRAVLASALGPAAFRYTTERHLDLDGLGIAVLIHRFVAGEAWGSAAWDPAASGPPLIEVTPPATAEALTGDVREKLERAVRELGRQQGPVEIEWVSSAGELTFLQMRGYQRAPEQPRWSGAAALGAGTWRWDAVHNPLPLSPAHADLIRWLNERCRLGFRQKVVGGYLFYSPHADPAAPDPSHPTETTPGQGMVGEATTARTHLTSLEVELARSLSALGATPSLEAALELFASAYQRLFAVVQPATRRARTELDEFLQAHQADSRQAVPLLLSGVPSVATDRRRAAARIRRSARGPARVAAVKDYLARFGDEAAIWDVAAATYREDPRLLEGLPPAATANDGHDVVEAAGSDGQMGWQRAARAVDARLPANARAIWPRLLREARDAVAVAEEDDHVYARLQAVVRRALLREGERLRERGTVAAAADIFLLPLGRVRADARGTKLLSRDEAVAEVQRARLADETARRAPPPLPNDPGRRETKGGWTNIIRGLPGAGGRAVGRACLYPPAPGSPPPDQTSIVVATTLLPAELPLIEAAGLVVETGGVLGHVAAQARERGVPAVVSAAGARARIQAGDQLLVDGDAGYVLRL